MKVYLKGIFELLRPYRWRILLSVLSALFVSGVPGSTAVLVKPVIDRVLVERNIYLLKLTAFGIFALYLVKGVAKFLHSYLMASVAYLVGRDLRNSVYSKLLRISFSAMEKRGSGEVGAYIMSDVSNLERAIPSLVLMVREPFTILGLLIAAIFMNWKLSLFAIFVLPFGFLPLVKFMNLLKRYGTIIQSALGRLNSSVNEAVGGMKVIKSFRKERDVEERFFSESETVLMTLLKYSLLQESLSPLMEVLGAVGVALVLLYGGLEVIRGNATPGSFLAFITACGLMYEPFKRFNYALGTIQHSVASFERINAFMGEIEEPQGGVRKFEGLKNEIEFQNVKFSYDSEEILRGVSFKVRAGERVAIVGRSGVGKTTLLSLLPRFYRESGGRILLDGIDINEFSVSSLRDKIAVIPQEAFLFNDTLRNNITMWEDYSDDEVMAAVELSGIKEVVERSPDGIYMKVGERGENLSGGERQRVAIARVLLRDPSIIILDEATASLDSETERKIQSAIEQLLRGRTTFIIAHRLSTVRSADRIIVLKDGVVVEEGTHDELIREKGEYWRIYREQFESS